MKVLGVKVKMNDRRYSINGKIICTMNIHNDIYQAILACGYWILKDQFEEGLQSASFTVKDLPDCVFNLNINDYYRIKGFNMWY